MFALTSSPLMTLALERATVCDASGKLVKVKTNVSRIVSLAPNLTEMLFAMGLGDKVVGVSSASDFPPAVKNLPKVGQFTAVSVEKIVSLRPDIVIATMDGNSQTDVEKLRSLNVEVFCIFPNSVAGLLDSINQLGMVLSCKRQAEKLVQNMQLAIGSVSSKARTLAKSKPKPKVLIALDLNPLVSASGQTFLGELVELAGGNNVVGGSSIRYPRLNLESIVALAPEVILVTGHGCEKALLKEVQEIKKWRGVPAVVNGRVYLLDPDLVTRPGPRIAGGLALIHERLYAQAPERRTK